MTESAVGGSSSSGPATDSANTPVVDPTRNVLDLVQAAVDKLEMQAAYIEKIAKIREDHFRELRSSEASRIDAIRAVDAQAVAAAAAVAETRATSLATQVSIAAETLRTTVAASDAAAARALSSALQPILESIQDLRKTQYTDQGQKTQVVESRAGVSTSVAVISAAAVVVSIVLTVVLFFITQSGK